MGWPSVSARTKTWGTEVLTSADQQGQLDVLHQYNNDQLNGAAGHGHTGGTSDGKKIDLTTAVSNTLPIANGGTGQVTIGAFLGLVYPIGCIYTTIDSTDPNTVFGFGTWVAFGAGRVLVGVDTGQTEFDTVQETGGEKTHILTVPEMPAHTHTVKSTGGSGTGYATAGFDTLSATTGSTGGDGAHNNLQPYITVYFFRRTA